MATSWNRFGQSIAEMDGAAAPAAAAPKTTDDKIELICRNLQESLKVEIMRDVMDKEKRDVRIYWGTATTGRPHVAYFVPMSKIADFLRAGCEVTILFADVHAFLDNMKAPWDLLKLRVEYYRECICGILESIGVSLDKLKFVVGSSFQLSSEYTLDMLKIVTMCSQHDAQRAGAEVVKQSASPPLSGLLYPIYQWLDEEYLHCDAQFGGVDQRKIFIGAQEYLPKIGYKARAHLMNPMVPGLTGEKMSASDVDSKIDLLDTPKQIEKKIKKVFCEPGNIEKNPLLAFVKAVILPIFGKFELERKGQDALNFDEYDALEAAFKEGEATIHPSDLKTAVIKYLVKLLEPVRKRFETPELQALAEAAYPSATKAKGGKASGKASGKTSGKAGAAAAAAASSGQMSAEVDVSRLNLRVGKILSVEKHPSADKLFIEKIDIGEENPRTVISGLVGKVEAEALLNREVVIVANMKPANMKGVKSEGMLLCASTDSCVEPLDPPAGCTIGERVFVEGFPGDPEPVLNPKKKIFEAVQPDLKVSSTHIACYKGFPLMTSKGPLKVATLVDAPIK
eukprot:m.292928 g.292928  ORF g.292928 m.292928 type:complete len:567 (-) comp12698_c0_seq1:193-1893(-)